MARDFTLDDFRTQLVHLRKQGTPDMIFRTPGMANLKVPGEDPQVTLNRVMRIINEMTEEERATPALIDDAAAVRIASAAGAIPEEVRELLVQFEQVRDVMRLLLNLTVWQRLKFMLGWGKLPTADDGTKPADGPA